MVSYKYVSTITLQSYKIMYLYRSLIWTCFQHVTFHWINVPLERFWSLQLELESTFSSRGRTVSMMMLLSVIVFYMYVNHGRGLSISAVWETLLSKIQKQIKWFVHTILVRLLKSQNNLCGGFTYFVCLERSEYTFVCTYHYQLMLTQKIRKRIESVQSKSFEQSWHK